MCVYKNHYREEPAPQRSERQNHGKLSFPVLLGERKRVLIFCHVKRRSGGFRRTSAVQSGPESSESEISEYSDDRFLSSDFTLVKNPEKEKGKRKSEIH